MTPNEIRREILSTIYNSDDRKFFKMEELEELREKVGDKDLHNEIDYLDDKGYIKTKKTITDGYFSVSITSLGIDLVENPKNFNKLFTISVNNLQNVSRSNISIDSPFSIQSLKENQNNKEIVHLLKEMKEAVDKKDANKSLNILKKIGSISKDVVIGVISNGIYEYLRSEGIIL